MVPGKILNKDEAHRLVALIQNIEKKTTGEIHIHIAKRTSRHGVMADAARIFHKLGMTKTRERNAVLLYISIKHRHMACIGDKGIHDKIGDEGWKKAIEELSASFKKGDYYLGLHKAVEDIGQVLIAHFPLRNGSHAENALSDEITDS